MKNKPYTLGIVLVLGSLLISGCGTSATQPTIGLANPASVYCEEQGYTLEMRTDENGTYGVCIFADGSECEEWAFYRGECKPASAPVSETSAETPAVAPSASATPVPPTPIPTATNTPVPPTETPVPLSALGQIAFMSNLHFEEGEGMQAYVMNADGSNPHRLTSGLGWQGPLSWSPDGQYIATARGGDIWVMDADGSNPRNLTNYLAGDQEPAWSPDGQHIAFSSSRAENIAGQAYAMDIFVMNADGSDPRNLTNSATSDTSPAWSPDGSHIVFQSDRDGNQEIYVMAADGSNPRNLTNHEGDDFGPAWSPDGRYIAFDSNRDRGGVDREIYLMEADGSNLRRLTDREGMNGLPTWSPDGRYIAFQSNRGEGSQEFCVMEVESGSVQRPTEHKAFMAAWSPSPQ